MGNVCRGAGGIQGNSGLGEQLSDVKAVAAIVVFCAYYVTELRKCLNALCLTKRHSESVTSTTHYTPTLDRSVCGRFAWTNKFVVAMTWNKSCHEDARMKMLEVQSLKNSAILCSIIMDNGRLLGD